MTDHHALLAKLTDIDRERLSDLIWGYDHHSRFAVDSQKAIFGVAPIDCGGTNSSDHSYRFGKLVKLGLAETRKRGFAWGEKPRRGYRGSNVYRPTQLGREVYAIIPTEGA